ncbi:MAG: TetR/AcrR family transcriptional regulator [Rhodospirillales bacterium CG15_BIG_FIL_POST_REV_8_21_14_020_66_15]|nr:MAG: TetR/AcrR family transcriptional regulator [Rhodospirillales bacterium CG15_BIG_FIL_POST_REV_8_21_14_020_66_15]
MDGIKERLLETAQALIQTRGYNGFSYRDIADKVGIRAASIHYHFPTKECLGAAVAAHYTDAFMAELDRARDRTKDPVELLRAYAGLFRRTLATKDRMCLCGMLAAEVAALPISVAAETKRFFQENLRWLTAVFADAAGDHGKASPSPIPEEQASHFLALLEGAMLVAKASGDIGAFDRTVRTELGRLQ